MTKIAGKITDAKDDQPIIGAKVIVVDAGGNPVDGGTRFAASGTQGQFTIEASPQEFLKFKSVGYPDRVVNVGQTWSSLSDVPVIPMRAGLELEEVVVTPDSRDVPDRKKRPWLMPVVVGVGTLLGVLFISAVVDGKSKPAKV